MNSLVIGSIHDNTEALETILTAWEPLVDEVVLTGNYFSLHSTKKTTLSTCKWLKTSLSRSKRTHLFGANERPFFFKDEHFASMHPSPRLLKSIRSELDWSLALNFKLVYPMQERWLVSSRGVIQSKMPAADSPLFETANLLNHKLKMQLRENSEFSLFTDSASKGGVNDSPGPATADWLQDFQPVSNLNQIVCDEDVQCFQLKLLVDNELIFLQPFTPNLPLAGSVQSTNIVVPGDLSHFVLIKDGVPIPLSSSSEPTIDGLAPFIKQASPTN